MTQARYATAIRLGSDHLHCGSRSRGRLKCTRAGVECINTDPPATTSYPDRAKAAPGRHAYKASLKKHTRRGSRRPSPAPRCPQFYINMGYGNEPLSHEVPAQRLPRLPDHRPVEPAVRQDFLPPAGAMSKLGMGPTSGLLPHHMTLHHIQHGDTTALPTSPCIFHRASKHLPERCPLIMCALFVLPVRRLGVGGRKKGAQLALHQIQSHNWGCP